MPDLGVRRQSAAATALLDGSLTEQKDTKETKGEEAGDGPAGMNLLPNELLQVPFFVPFVCFCGNQELWGHAWT
jgi:hypothetical protein